ncbi:MAG: hypothetical protein ABIO68_03105 [Sphingomicrobium sp.]
MIGLTLAATLAGCNDKAPDKNFLIDTNVPADAEFESLPPDESSGVSVADNGVASDTRSPEERGDGDDMVRIVDDTSKNRSEQ